MVRTETTAPLVGTAGLSSLVGDGFILLVVGECAQLAGGMDYQGKFAMEQGCTAIDSGLRAFT